MLNRGSFRSQIPNLIADALQVKNFAALYILLMFYSAEEEGLLSEQRSHGTLCGCK